MNLVTQKAPLLCIELILILCVPNKSSQTNPPTRRQDHHEIGSSVTFLHNLNLNDDGSETLSQVVLEDDQRQR